MKKRFICIAIFGIIALFSHTSANAQSNWPVTATIPFDFSIGEKKMPAGEYLVERLAPGRDKYLHVISRRDGKAAAILAMLPDTVNEQGITALLFNRYGNDYYLSEIRNPPAGFGGKLRKNKPELELARKFGKPKSEAISMTLQKN